jgi:DMSO/TMAO reductase YedYZ heme-binding membrane subunit
MFWGGLMVLIAALGFLGWATSILYVGHYSQMSGGSRRARLGARFFNSIYEYFGITGVVVAMLAMSILCFYVSYKVFKKRLDY